MTTPESLDNTVLALSPPRAPEATTPVIGSDYGVPKHVYDLKPMGLKVDIDPPLSGTVHPGDVITLVLNKQSVATKPINPGEENAVNTLYIPKGLLLTDRLNELVYTITRGSQNIGTSTPILTLLYNAIRPGIEDTTPGDGAHSRLELILPPDVIEDGIDADRAKQGVQVCFSYPYCRAHDLIWLNCNGQDVYRTVTVAEAPAIPSAEPTTVCVMVDETVFERAGDSPKFVFSYTVTDQLGNGPDTDSPFSASYEVDVHLKDTRLVAPDMAEDPNDPNDDPTTIDRDKLGQKDLTVLVNTFAPQWQPNDKIRVTYTATPASGAVVPHTVETDVVRIPFTYKLMVPNAKVIASNVARAKYELIRNGTVIATSKTTTADISGGGGVDLLAPFLVKPAANPIDVLAYPEGVTVRIEYLEALDGDRARLVEVNAPAGSPQFPLVAFNSNKRVNTLLTPAFLAARQGKEIALRWNLNRGGGQAGKSPVLKLRVLKIADGDARLPVPEILEAKGTDKLQLIDFEGDATFRLLPWSFIEEGQLISAALTNDVSDPLVILSNSPITTEEAKNGVTKSISRNWLSNLPPNKPLLLETKILPKNTLNLPPINLPKKQYTIEPSRFPISEDWENEPAQHFTVNRTVNFKSGIVFTLTSGVAYLEKPNSSQYPAHLGNMTLLLARGQSIFQIPGEASSISFTINSNHAPGSVIFKTKHNLPIATLPLPTTGDHVSQTIIFNAPTGVKATSFELNIPDDLYADNFLIK